MKKLFLATACAWLLIIVPPAAAGPSEGADELGKLIAGNVHSLSVEVGEIDGPGAEWLVERAEKSQFVLLGESHMTAEIPRIARGIWRAVHPLGYEHVAIETSPWTASLMEEKLRSGNDAAYSDYVTDGNLWTIPFYTTIEETAFLRSVIEASVAEGKALWGLDQIFKAEGVRVLKKLQALATTDRQREAVAETLESARDNPGFVGTAGRGELESLEAVFGKAEGEAGRLVSQLLASHEIYGPFSRGEGNVYEANRLREDLMKRNFMDYYRQAELNRDAFPKVFFKFGAFHMFRGFTPTHVLGLGNFITEFATAQGSKSLSILAACSGGKQREYGTGEAVDCQGLELPEVIAGSLPDDGYVLLDLAALRSHHDQWAKLPDLLKKVIWSFDAMIVVPEATPATLPGGEAAS